MSPARDELIDLAAEYDWAYDVLHALAAKDYGRFLGVWRHNPGRYEGASAPLLGALLRLERRIER